MSNPFQPTAVLTSARTSQVPKIPLRYALIVPFVLLIVGATGLVGYLSWRNGQRAVNQIVNQLNHEISDRIRQKLSSYLSSPVLINQTNADLIGSGILNGQDTTTLSQHFWRQINLSDAALYLYFGDTQGQYTGSERFSNGSIGVAFTGGEAQSDVLTYQTDVQGNPTELIRTDGNYDPRTRTWYLKAVETGQSVWSEIYPDFASPNRLGMTFAQPVYNAAGELQGVVAIDYLIDEVNEFLRSVRISPSGQSFIIERSGLLVGSSSPNSSILDARNQQRLSALQSEDLLTRLTTQYLNEHFGNLNQITTNQQLSFSLNGERQFVRITPFSDEYGLDWLIVTAIPESDFTTQIDDNVRTTLLLSIGTLTGAIVFGLLLARWILRPIQRLSQASRALANGEWNSTLQNNSPITELHILHQSFGQTAEQLQQALQNSETKLNHLLNSAIAAITSKRIYPNGDWEYEYWSGNCEVLFGYTAQELMTNKMLWRSRVHPDDLSRAIIEGERAYKEIAYYAEEYRFYHKDGSLRWMLGHITSRQKGDYWLITAINIDITDRKRVEEELRQSQTRLQNLATAAPVNVYSMVQHPNGSIEFEYINRVAEDFHEISLEEFVKNPADYVIGQMHPADREGYFTAAAHSAETLQPFKYEWRIIPASGKLKWLQARSQPERRENGDLCWHGVVLDVTDRKLADEELRQSEAALRRAQQVAHVGSWELDIHTEQVTWSEESFHIFGLDPTQPEPTLSEFYALIHPDDLPELQRSIKHTIETKAPYKVEFRSLLPDGSMRQVEARGETIVNEQGEVIRLIGTNLDITDRKQIEENIRQSEATKNQILKTIPDLIVWMTSDGTCIDLIDGSNITTFIPRSVAVGKNLFDYMPADLAQERMNAIQQALYTGDVQVYEQKITNDGITCYEEVRVVAIDADKVLTIIRDITDRKQAEAALEAQRAFLRQVIDVIPSPVFVKDAEGRFIIANQALAAIHNLTVDEMLGKREIDFNPQFTSALMEQYLAENREIMASRQLRQNAPHVLTLPSGEQRWYQSYLSPFVDAHEQVQGIVGNSVDITDLKQIEETLRQQNQALRESEARFRSAFQDAPIGMALIGLDNHWLRVNPRLCDMLGYSEAELRSMNATALVHPEDVEKLQHSVEQVLSNENYSAQVELRYQCHSGRMAWGLMSVSLVRDAQKQPLYYVAQVQDITERQAIDRMKNEFISIVSHELRTPLTAIRGFLGLIDTGIYDAKPEKAKRMIKHALTNSDRLVRLVNDILDLERLDSGRIQLVMEVCDAAELIRQAVEGVQSIADGALVNLTILPTTAQVWVAPDSILQTLTNLLSNAIKFSPPHSTITISAQPQTDSVLFQVKDQGRGIPADKIESIFGRFQQVDVSDARQKGGTGLGLAICQSIVQQHGGNIWAESTLGEGSTFCFTLPSPSQSMN